MKDTSSWIILILVVTCMFLTLIIFNLLNSKIEPNKGFISNLSPIDTEITENRNVRQMRTVYEIYHVGNTIKKNMNNFRECYIEYLKDDPEVTDGDAYIDWMINPNGSSKEFGVVSSPFNKTLNNCIRKTILQIHFPPPPSAREVYTSYIFPFRKTD